MGVLERYGGKLQSMTYLVAIKDAFTDLMPIIIIGSFATLINNVICSTSNGLAQFAGFEFLSQFSGIFSAINLRNHEFPGHLPGVTGWDTAWRRSARRAARS